MRPARADGPRPTRTAGADARRCAVYNTLTRRKDVFEPLEPGRVKIYTCGPTVYRHAHIGNLRSYLMADWLRRLLEAQGYTRPARQEHHRRRPHATGDARPRRGQGDRRRPAEGKTPQEIAAFYTDAFLADERRLNILPATSSRARREYVAGDGRDDRARWSRSGYAYESGGNVYFAVARFPEYGKLSGQTCGRAGGGRARRSRTR